MDVVICPECQIRMIPKPDGSCPSCHAVICLETAERPEPVEFGSQTARDNRRRDAANLPTALELPDTPDFPELADEPTSSLAHLAAELGSDSSPRQLPARFKRKTLGARLLPRKTSLQLARVLGYLFGGISTVAGFALILGGRFAGIPRSRTAGTLAIAFGGFLIAMAKREA